MPKAAIRAEQLEKRFSSGFTLGPINLTINFGEAVAIMGGSHSGKSALLNLITGSNEASSGAVYIDEKKMHYDAFDVKRMIGYLPQYIELPRRLTLMDVFETHARFHYLKNQDKKIQSAVERWDLVSFLEKKMINCPYSIRKRIALALSELHDPDLLVLDEPFSELDLFQIQAVEDMIRTRSQQGQVTLIATHLVYYAAMNCHRGLWVNNGLLSEIPNWDEKDFQTRMISFTRLF